MLFFHSKYSSFLNFASNSKFPFSVFISFQRKSSKGINAPMEMEITIKSLFRKYQVTPFLLSCMLIIPKRAIHINPRGKLYTNLHKVCNFVISRHFLCNLIYYGNKKLLSLKWELFGFLSLCVFILFSFCSLFRYGFLFIGKCRLFWMIQWSGFPFITNIYLYVAAF